MKISKTNIGHKIAKQENFKNEGAPNLKQKVVTFGNIIDIRYPGDPILENMGIQVRIAFDDRSKENRWFPLLEDYGHILASIGNREAVLRLSPRVRYTYVPGNFEFGYAEVLCDNTQEKSFSLYQRNRCSNFTGLFSSLTYNLNPPGY